GSASRRAFCFCLSRRRLEIGMTKARKTKDRGKTKTPGSRESRGFLSMPFHRKGMPWATHASPGSDLGGELGGLLQRGLNAVLRDEANAGAGHAQGHPTLLRRHPKALLLDVDLEPLAGVVHGVGHLHARLALLTGDFACAAHDCLEQKRDDSKLGVANLAKPPSKSKT